MRVRKFTGLAWALLQSAWTAILALLLVPVYLHYVGTDGYGLIGFFASLQAVVMVLDLGLTPAASRETARLIQANEQQELRDTLRTLEICVFVLAILVGFFLALASQYIASSWLQSNAITSEQLRKSLLLMAIAIALKWPIGHYHGILIGSERLALSSQVHLFFATLAGLGSITVFITLSPTVVAFFLWQCFVTALHLIYLRWKIFTIFMTHSRCRFNIASMRRILPFSMQMAGVAAIGLVFTQMDRILLSNMLTLDAFAAYAAAVLLASGLHIVIGPVFNSIYPRFISHVQRKSHLIATEQYVLTSSLLLAVLVPFASFVALNAHLILYTWTGDAVISAEAAPVLELLVMGYAINGLMYPAYALQLAYGLAKLPMYINAGLALILAPLLYFSVSHFGATGAGFSWLCVSTMYLFLGTWATWHFLELPIMWRTLLMRLVLPAMFLLLLTYILASNLQPTMNSWLRLTLTAGITITCSLSYLIALENTRQLLLIFKNRIWTWIG